MKTARDTKAEISEVLGNFNQHYSSAGTRTVF